MAGKSEETIQNRIRARARALGFDLAGIAPAGIAPAGIAPAQAGEPALEAYRAWLARGLHGEMAYLARPDAVARRADLARTLPGVQSVVVAGLNYQTRPLPAALRDDASRGVIGSYAWGPDYHDLMLPRLEALAAAVAEETGQPAAHRAYVDTGPLLERALAVRAGLGFVGRNTSLIQPRLGSWLFLGELLTTAPLAGETPVAGGTCGRCTRCLRACPTAAFPAPYVLDARRCISYLTIELKGPIPRELRPLLGNRIFGCDICQEVCPWNRRFARPTGMPALWPDPAPATMAPRLLELLALDEEGFRRRFAGSPVMRARRRGLLRNVAVAVGNWGDPAAVPGLVRVLEDAEPLVRGHAAWALGRIGGARARAGLRRALAGEKEGWVREEMEGALGA